MVELLNLLYLPKLIHWYNACADPGIFVRGVQVNLTKKALITFFFFFSPQLIFHKSNG